MKNKQPLIDFDNTQQLAEDIWLFLTNAKLPAKATINKKAFLHEVKTMLDTVREHTRTRTLESLSVMSPKQFQQFLLLKNLNGQVKKPRI